MIIRPSLKNFYRNLPCKPFIPMNSSAAHNYKTKVQADLRSQTTAYGAIQQLNANALNKKLTSSTFSESKKDEKQQQSESNTNLKIGALFFFCGVAEFEYQMKFKQYFSDSSLTKIDSQKNGESSVQKTQKTTISLPTVDKEVESPEVSLQESLSLDIKEELVGIGELSASQPKEGTVDGLYETLPGPGMQPQEQEIVIPPESEEVRRDFDFEIVPKNKEIDPPSILEEQSDPIETENEITVSAFDCNNSLGELKDSNKQGPVAVFITTLLLSAAVLFYLAKDKK